MPSKTQKQAKFMQAVAHNPQFAQKVGVPQSVGEDFNSADEQTGILTKILTKSLTKKRKRKSLGVLSRSENVQ